MAGRRTVQTAYSTLKMYAMMKLRLSHFYEDPTLAAGLAAMAVGARDAKYAPYKAARLPATSFAKDANLYGTFVCQVQSAIMNIRKLGIDLAENKCRAIYAYVDTHGLNSVKINGVSAGDAVLAYFGCISLPKPSVSEEEKSDLETIESEIDAALRAKGATVTAEGGTEQQKEQESQQKTVETNVEGVEKNAEKAAEQTVQQSSGQAAQQTGTSSA